MNREKVVDLFVGKESFLQIHRETQPTVDFEDDDD